MHDPQIDHGHRVTPLELFFDLVFVFAITQVTGFLADAAALVPSMKEPIGQTDKPIDLKRRLIVREESRCHST